jgi:hypothetical protein
LCNGLEIKGMIAFCVGRACVFLCACGQ